MATPPKVKFQRESQSSNMKFSVHTSYNVLFSFSGHFLTDKISHYFWTSDKMSHYFWTCEEMFERMRE